MVAAPLRQTFLQPDHAHASAMLRHVADQSRPKWPNLTAFIDDSETDVLSYLDFPEEHRGSFHSTNPLERLNKEVKRRDDSASLRSTDCRRLSTKATATRGAPRASLESPPA
jgi:transposase-like protein